MQTTPTVFIFGLACSDYIYIYMSVPRLYGAYVSVVASVVSVRAAQQFGSYSKETPRVSSLFRMDIGIPIFLVLNRKGAQAFREHC